ncbi:MAG: MerR family transcriptional regulator [Proteobacteria bacterium]|nr:MerR family transcriptional regulator [Pseudomonadota bacterium]
MIKIGEMSKRTGIPVTTIRYYEKVGLLPAPGRLESGYRLYNRAHLERINFLKNTRKLGFSQQRIKALVSLLENPNRTSEKVKISVQSQLEEIREKRLLIQNIENQLKQIIAKCDGGEKSECPILETFHEET